MKWTTELPTKPGTYAWREIGNRSPHPELAVIFRHDGNLCFTFERGGLLKPTPPRLEELATYAPREWLGPLEES
jgi:hypothetical protein